jgi:hypothetical protein
MCCTSTVDIGFSLFPDNHTHRASRDNASSSVTLAACAEAGNQRPSPDEIRDRSAEG